IIERPVMFQDWRVLTFLHWRYPVAEIQRLLPPGVEVETCQGEAWVSLVPFLMDRVRAPGVPALPWLSRFPETNVRTYVRGRVGQLRQDLIEAAGLPGPDGPPLLHASPGVRVRLSRSTVVTTSRK